MRSWGQRRGRRRRGRRGRRPRLRARRDGASVRDRRGGGRRRRGAGVALRARGRARQEPCQDLLRLPRRERIEDALVGHPGQRLPDHLVPAAALVPAAEGRRVGRDHRIGRAEDEEHGHLARRAGPAVRRAAGHVGDGREARRVGRHVPAQVRRAAAVPRRVDPGGVDGVARRHGVDLRAEPGRVVAPLRVPLPEAPGGAAEVARAPGGEEEHAGLLARGLPGADEPLQAASVPVERHEQRPRAPRRAPRGDQGLAAGAGPAVEGLGGRGPGEQGEGRERGGAVHGA